MVPPLDTKLLPVYPNQATTSTQFPQTPTITSLMRKLTTLLTTTSSSSVPQTTLTTTSQLPPPPPDNRLYTPIINRSPSPPPYSYTTTPGPSQSQPLVSLRPSLVCREYIINGQVQMTDECLSETQMMVVVGIGAFCVTVCMLLMMKFIYNKLQSRGSGGGRWCCCGRGDSRGDAGQESATRNQLADLPPSYIEVTEDPPSYDWFVKQYKPDTNTTNSNSIGHSSWHNAPPPAYNIYLPSSSPPAGLPRMPSCHSAAQPLSHDQVSTSVQQQQLVSHDQPTAVQQQEQLPLVPSGLLNAHHQQSLFSHDQPAAVQEHQQLQLVPSGLLHDHHQQSLPQNSHHSDPKPPIATITQLSELNSTRLEDS